MRQWTYGLAALVAAGLGAAPGASESAGAKPGLRVVASVAPVAGLVRGLLPEGATLTTLAAPGQSEHGFEITPRMVEALGAADLAVLVGFGMEPQVERLLERLPGAPGSGATAPAVLVFADVVGHGETAQRAEPGHEHEDDDGHDHGGEDPHVWLDPRLAGKFVAAASDALLAALTERGGADSQTVSNLKAARRRVTSEIAEVEGEYKEALAPHAGAWLVTQHDAFGRLAARFGLRARSIRVSGEGAEPTPGAMAEVLALLKETNARAIFAEPQSDDSAMKRLARAAGVKVLTLDPLGDGDWFAMMRANLEAMKEGLSGE